MSHSNIPMNHVWFVSRNIFLTRPLSMSDLWFLLALFFLLSWKFCLETKTSSNCQHCVFELPNSLPKTENRGQDLKSQWYSWTIADVQKDEGQCEGTEGLREGFFFWEVHLGGGIFFNWRGYLQPKMSCRTGKCRLFFLLRRLYLLFGMHQAEVIFSIYCAQDIPAETELLATSLNILVGSMTFGRI